MTDQTGLTLLILGFSVSVQTLREEYEILTFRISQKIVEHHPEVAKMRGRMPNIVFSCNFPVIFCWICNFLQHFRNIPERAKQITDSVKHQ